MTTSRQRTLFLFLGLYCCLTTISAFVTVVDSQTSSSALQAAAVNEGFVAVSRSPDKDYQLAYRVVRPMSLASRKAAPIVALHGGGPPVPSNYLYPLEQVVPYRSIVFYDPLGCGKSDEPHDPTQYSLTDSIQDLKTLLKKLGIRRFHLYGQSFGGILAFEYMKDLVSNNNGDGDDEIECLSAIFSSVPTRVKDVEAEADRLVEELRQSSSNNVGDEELQEMFRRNHICRLPEIPVPLQDAYAGTVWRGTAAISDYVAHPPPQDASRMPSTLLLRGEFDFVPETSIQAWKTVFNTKFLRFRTLEGCSHHGLLENGSLYGEIVDSYFGEYD